MGTLSTSTSSPSSLKQTFTWIVYLPDDLTSTHGFANLPFTHPSRGLAIAIGPHPIAKLLTGLESCPTRG